MWKGGLCAHYAELYHFRCIFAQLWDISGSKFGYKPLFVILMSEPQIHPNELASERRGDAVMQQCTLTTHDLVYLCNYELQSIPEWTIQAKGNFN